MKKRYKILIFLLAVIIGLLFAFKLRVIINPPIISENSIKEYKRDSISDKFYTLEESWLKQNKYGLWELFLEGDALYLGIKNGILTKELSHYQEQVFVDQIKEIIPSDFYISFLKYFIAWFNRDIDKYIPLEYQKEIYGVSLNASTDFEFIAPNYHRILNYHAAHDIGHTIQNMNLVACTAFGTKNGRTADSSIIVGRNMDFFAGENFAKNKIVAFYKPEQGYNFAYITWAGLIGVISGMNSEGLTISLNSAKSDIPTAAKMPVSILARKILQYASTIDEALEIAKANKTFVAESFLISSAKDNDFAIIEKSTKKTALYHQKNNEIILSNHFQSAEFENRKLTIENKKETETVYRWNRVEELLQRSETQDVGSVIAILRDQRGLNDKEIGYSNEMAINQLIAHHSLVFKPQQRQMWVSVGPYQLGEYLCYDLNQIFSDSLDITKAIYKTELTIEADSFLYSQKYKDFIEYKETIKNLRLAIAENNLELLTEENFKHFKSLNANYFNTYLVIGDCYVKLDKKELAVKNYRIALTKEIAKKYEKDNIISKIDALLDCD